MRKVFSFYGVLGGMFLIASLLSGYTKTAKSPNAFVTAAGHAGMAEVALANLALAKSQREDIRLFAQTMISDHGWVEGELKALAISKNYDFPAELSAGQKTNADALS